MTNHFSTQAVHAGEDKRKPYGALTTPIVQTSTYTFENTAEIMEFMHRKAVGDQSVRNEYGRYSNPTQSAAERKIAALERGEKALLFASGMCAITTTMLTLLSSGDHLVMVSDAYRRTHEFACSFLIRWGIETTLVPVDDPAVLAAAIRPTTRLIFSETPTNPYLRVMDLEKMVEIASRHNIITAIDSTFATPINMRPLEYGVDLAIHSATKYLGGHNDLLAGVVIGPTDILARIKAARGVLGGMSNPHDAYLLLRGLKTLDLRVHRQNENGLRVAQFLEEHPAVRRVYYPGLPSHPDHEIARRQMAGFGGVVSFEIEGDFEKTGRFIDRLRLPYVGPTLGGVESVIEQCAALFSLDQAERQQAGIKDNLVRYALGIEDAEDLIADLDQALAGIQLCLWRLQMIVHKFGGTSLGDAQCFASVVDIVIEHHNKAEMVIVVSAMSGVTDQLIAGARAAAEGKDTVYREIKAGLLSRHLDVVETLLGHSPERLDAGGLVEDRLHDLERLYRSIAVLGELTVRGCDAVASFGEQLSASILAAVLRDRGLRAQAMSATELIVTDDNFGAATPLMEQTRQRLQQRVKPLVERGVIPVITGYIAATENGVTTTLGRGGGDFSAAIIGAGLNADEMWIWTDVDGILTADPNIVPQARTLTELSYTEAANLAYFGAEVLHPKTVRPVAESGIVLRILNTFNPSNVGGDARRGGTLIVETPSPNRELWPAIISTSGLSMIAVGSQDDSWTLEMAARALHRLSEAGVDVLMFSQSFSEHSLNLVVRQQDQAHCLKALRREFGNDRQGGICSLGIKEQVATISVVGVPGWNEAGIVSHAFAALGKHGTRVIAVAQAATEHSVSFCIPEDQMADTVRFLHRELGLEGGSGYST